MVDKLTVSASQFEDFLDCPRRWWFKKVMHLPLVQRDYFTFGTVLHGCLERWMSADLTGRVPGRQPKQDMLPDYTKHAILVIGPLAGQRPGDPVNVFPEGWERAGDASVTPNEARLIRRLFAEAIERGIVQRGPGQQVEREVNLPLLDDVDLTGFLDVFRPSAQLEHISTRAGFPEPDQTVAISMSEVHDHKTFGEGSVRYLKQPGPRDVGGHLLPIDAAYAPEDGTSPNSVGHNQQMLTYAAATSIVDGYNGPVLVRHNQFPKFEDLKGVRTVEAVVSAKRVREHWAFLQDAARRMLAVREIKRWQDVPGPESLDSCSRYGGCAFQTICGKKETTDSYQRRISKQLETQAGRTRPNLRLEPRKGKEKRTVGSTDIFERARVQAAQRAARNGPTQQVADALTSGDLAGAAKIVSNVLGVNSGPATPPPANLTGGAPWANPACPACKGVGINSKGRACPICDGTAKRAGRPTSVMYALEKGEGGYVAVALPQHEEALQAAGMPLEWVQGSFDAPKPAPAPVAAKAEPKPTPVFTESGSSGGAKITTIRTVPILQATSLPKSAGGTTIQTDIAPPAEPAPEPAKGEAKPVAEKDGRGRPRVGVALLLGTVQLKGPERVVVLAQDLLERVGAEMAKDMGAASYWELDQYKRKDRMKQRGEALAAGLNRTVVVFPGGLNDFDLIALFNALEPHAAEVYGAMR